MFTTEQQKEIFQAIKANEEKTSGIIHVHIRKKCKQTIFNIKYRVVKWKKLKIVNNGKLI